MLIFQGIGYIKFDSNDYCILHGMLENMDVHIVLVDFHLKH